WITSRTASEVTKHSGLDLENKSHSSGRGGAFFLTSLFIELIDHGSIASNECKGLIAEIAIREVLF
ncbi:MAG: hypothetical protein WBF04_11420, partial [Candidatus Sulfotelmatobacter sp.]